MYAFSFGTDVDAHVYTPMIEAREKLRARLTEFDGRNMTVMGEAEARFKACASYIGDLVALAADEAENISSAAMPFINETAHACTPTLQSNEGLHPPQ